MIERFFKQKLRIAIMFIVITVVGNLINKLYYTPDKEYPTIYNVSYNKQADFILIACDIFSIDQVEDAEIHYNNEVVKMNYGKSLSGQPDRVRYSITIPLVDDNVEVKIVAYDNDGDSSTYIIEK